MEEAVDDTQGETRTPGLTCLLGPWRLAVLLCQSYEGTPLTNPTRIYVLTLRAGENTCDVLRNMALPNLGGSVWYKRWHHEVHCFSG